MQRRKKDETTDDRFAPASSHSITAHFAILACVCFGYYANARLG